MFLNLITKEVFQFDYVHPKIDKTYGFPHTVHMLHVNPDNNDIHVHIFILTHICHKEQYEIKQVRSSRYVMYKMYGSPWFTKT